MCNSVSYAGRMYQTPTDLADLVGGAQNLI
jgi:hypothetical protein